jgi:protein arginine kinase
MLSHTVHTRPDGWFAEDGPQYESVVSTRVRLARNLSTYPFPHRMTNDQVLDLRRSIETVLQASEEAFTVLDARVLGETARMFFRGRGLLPVEDPDAVTYVRDDERLFLQPGREEHLRINAFAGGLDLDRAWHNAQTLDTTLEHGLTYAVSMRLGYLSAMIDRVGTGLSASIMMHLPALAHIEDRGELRRHLADGESTRITVRGFGVGEYSTASLHIFTCRAALGEEETETLAVLERFAERLLHYEREARDELSSRHGDEFAEAASRAYGTLLHARKLGLDEALELLSVLRLAVCTGHVEAVRAGDCTRLLFLVQDSQVAALMPDAGVPIDARRAQLVRSVFDRTDPTQET